MKYIISLVLIVCNIYTFYAQENTIPVIRLTGEFGYDYQNGSVTIEYPDGRKEENIEASIKMLESNSTPAFFLWV